MLRLDFSMLLPRDGMVLMHDEESLRRQSSIPLPGTINSLTVRTHADF
jgi:hypothetical protein